MLNFILQKSIEIIFCLYDVKGHLEYECTSV